jgi:hypothetical protein
VAFVIDALSRGEADRQPLRELASDPAALDDLLDDPALFRRLLHAPRFLHVSPWFFYYVLVRRAFLDHGIDHRRASDYVGALLSYHVQMRSTEPRSGGGVYLVDVIAAMAEARTADDAFLLQTRVGDIALFLAGLYPDWIYTRETYGRRPIGLSYYERMGSAYWRAAARTPAAERYDLGDVLEFMAQRFPALRQALNDLVDDHLDLAPRPPDVSALCRRALYRVRN